MFFSQAVVIQYDYFHYRLQMQYGNAQVMHYGSIFISQVASSIVRSMAVSICGFQENSILEWFIDWVHQHLLQSSRFVWVGTSSVPLFTKRTDVLPQVPMPRDWLL